MPWTAGCLCDPGPFFSTCSKDRRLLKNEENSNHYYYYSWKGHNEPEYGAFVKACGDLDYEGGLYIDEAPHFYAIAAPKGDAMAAGCPFLAASVEFDSDNVSMHKQMSAWEDIEVAESFFSKESLAMGTFQAADLVSAFEESNAGGGSYDVLTNNCAGFLLSIASHLGVRIGSRETKFVTRRLLEENAKGLVQRIKSSVNYQSLFQDRHLLRADTTTTTDEDLIELVVEGQVAGYGQRVPGLTAD